MTNKKELEDKQLKKVSGGKYKWDTRIKNVATVPFLAKEQAYSHVVEGLTSPPYNANLVKCPLCDYHFDKSELTPVGQSSSTSADGTITYADQYECPNCSEIIIPLPTWGDFVK